MFPISDDNPRVRFPLATVTLIGMNVFVWVAVQGLGNQQMLAESLCQYALIPGELLGRVGAGAVIPLGEELVCQLDGAARPASLFSSMFMHGGWLHLIGNMWFLWIFGDNVEDALGPLRYVAFYLLCGLAAALAQIASNPASLVPMVGASGAIGGVMGAYALLFPRAHVKLLVFLGVIVTTVVVPAVFMLAYWFLLQLLQGIPALGAEGGGVAFWAHAGGFLAGIVLALLLRRPPRGRPPAPGRWF